MSETADRFPGNPARDGYVYLSAPGDAADRDDTLQDFVAASLNAAPCLPDEAADGENAVLPAAPRVLVFDLPTLLARKDEQTFALIAPRGIHARLPHGQSGSGIGRLADLQAALRQTRTVCVFDKTSHRQLALLAGSSLHLLPWPALGLPGAPRDQVDLAIIMHAAPEAIGDSLQRGLAEMFPDLSIVRIDAASGHGPGPHHLSTTRAGIHFHVGTSVDDDAIRVVDSYASQALVLQLEHDEATAAGATRAAALTVENLRSGIIVAGLAGLVTAVRRVMDDPAIAHMFIARGAQIAQSFNRDIARQLVAALR